MGNWSPKNSELISIIHNFMHLAYFRPWFSCFMKKSKDFKRIKALVFSLQRKFFLLGFDFAFDHCIVFLYDL